MNTQLHIMEEPKKTFTIHPKKFAMWLFITTVVMIFASLTSAYIVRQAEGNWLIFELPKILWVNSGIILFSSIFMHWAYVSAKNDNTKNVKIGIGAVAILGFTFLIGQVMAWGDLVNSNIFLVGNPSGSFVYVLTGLHSIHLVGGLIFLLIVLKSTIKLKVHSKNMAQIEMCTTFWHFLGGLWLYLFIFLLLYR
ncbi:MAG: cytochrome c oxidase subunit 3 [Cyclobacteriaceae bacterium]|nr:cytochrome c oxidase subunit 3 [Cyclobacteriaceae bacterium]